MTRGPAIIIALAGIIGLALLPLLATSVSPRSTFCSHSR